MFSKARPPVQGPAPSRTQRTPPDAKAAPSAQKVKSLPVQSAQTGSARASSPKPESKSHSTPDRILQAQALPVSPAVARMVHKDLAAIIGVARKQLGDADAKTSGSRPEHTRTLLEQAKVDFTPWSKKATEQENLAFMLQQLASTRAAMVSAPARASERRAYDALLGAFLTGALDAASNQFKPRQLKFLLQAFPSAAVLKTPHTQRGFAFDFTTALLAQLGERPGLEMALVEWIISDAMRADHEAPLDLLVWRHTGLFEAAMYTPATRLLLQGQLGEALQNNRNMPAASWVALGYAVGVVQCNNPSTLSSMTGLTDDVFESVAAADPTLTSAAWFLSGLIRSVCLRTQTAGPSEHGRAQESNLQTALGRYLRQYPRLAAVTARDPDATAFDALVLHKIAAGDVQKLLYPRPARSQDKAPGLAADQSAQQTDAPFVAAVSDQQTDAPFVAAMSEEQTDAPFVAAISTPTPTGPTASSSSQDRPAPGPGAY